VQALKADGEQMWQSKLPTVTNSSVPDGFGGLIVTEYDTCTPGQTNPMTIAGLNPQNGQPWWQISAAAVQYGQQTIYCYPSGPGGAPQIAVRGDGAVIITEPTNNGLPPVMMVGGPSQGVYSIPTSTSTDAQGVTIDVQCCTGPPMVNSDGTAYLEYEVRNIGFTKMISDTLYLFQINPDNSSKSTVLSSTTQNEALLPGSIIPDGQGGILATWTISPSIGPLPQYPYQAADVVSGQVGTPYNLPFSPKTLESGKSPTLVLGENGTAFGAGSSTSTDGTNTAVDQIASFNVTTGVPNWTYQGTQGNAMSIIAATDGNGLVAKTTDQNGNDTVLAFDSSGAPQSQTLRGLGNSTPTPMADPQQAGVSGVDYYANGWYLGFKGNNSVAVSGNGIQFSIADGTRPRGDAQHNGTTDPGYRVVGVRDCANKYTVSGTSYERLPIYELWNNKGHKPSQTYTLFEYVTDNSGNITDFTKCGNQTNTGTTPCGYVDGSSAHPYNTFKDDLAILGSNEAELLQYFRYGLPGQRVWDAQIYRTVPDGSGTVQFVPHVSLTIDMRPSAEPLIQQQLAPYMGPWYNSSYFDSCNTSTPIQ
jgi:hypothetical protein